MNRFAKSVSLFCLLILPVQISAVEIDKTAGIKDTNTTVMGINHIGISVRDLDTALPFYQKATGFELLSRQKISGNKDADTLFGQSDLVMEVAVLKAPNMLFELTEFKRNAEASIERMPAAGPGMTHTCFQSPEDDSGFDKFLAAGAVPLSTGGRPVDLGGYGVTYAYAYDPEGNMIELEQLDGEILARAGYDDNWKNLDAPLWMSQVALATHDIERLMEFYQMVLGFKPYRVAELSDNEKVDQIAGGKNLHLKGGWFKMSDTSKVIEFWQYLNPETPKYEGKRETTALGYSFSLEVADMDEEYKRLLDQGVEFVSEPVNFGDFRQVYARDIDGNIFSLREANDPESLLSVRKMDEFGKAN